MAQVTTCVHVHRRGDGGGILETVRLMPGDQVPSWAQVDPSLLAPEPKKPAPAPKPAPKQVRKGPV